MIISEKSVQVAEPISLLIPSLVRHQLVELVSRIEVCEARVVLELHGYSLGARITDRLMLDRPRCHAQRDIFKFVCRELWQLFFQKQADRLQTNKKGGYIIFEETSPWLKNRLLYQATIASLPHVINSKESQRLPEPSMASILLSDKERNRTRIFGNSADAQAALICGIIRGALTTLGCPCLVSYEMDSPPSCTFHALTHSGDAFFA